VISQTAEYALRAAVFLASSRERAHPAWEISEATHIPASYLAKVLGALARAGLVESQRGPRGGFVLARDPRALTILEIVRAVETWKHIECCPLGRPDHEGHFCPLHRRLSEAVSLVEHLFHEWTLGDLVEPAPARGVGD
jgi:Rrf2 family transcriptional regulator, nitric oxide-sensitive transcriptional repressor